MYVCTTGGLQYLKDQTELNTLVNHSIAIETDEGVFYPVGLGVQCSQTSNGGCGMAIAQLETLAPLLDSVGGGKVTSGGGGADIDPICQTGIVCAGVNVLDTRLANGASNNPCINDAMGAWEAPVFDIETQTMYDSGYFWYHHSEADTMETIDPEQINRVAASLAIWTYAIAELPELLPRDEAAPPDTTSDDSDKSFFTAMHIGLIIGSVVLVTALIAAFVVYKYKLLPDSKGKSESHHSDEEDLAESMLRD
jgi:hypothetical protein